MGRLTPVLMVKDVNESIDFYKRMFGFIPTIVVPDENAPVFAAIEKDGVEIMLQERESMEGEYPLFKGKKIGGTVTLYLDLGEVRAIYDTCKKQKAEIIVDIHTTFYGANEFAIVDNNGFVVVLTKR